jgi:hypothetical protein
MHCHCAPRRDTALSSPPASRRTGGSPHWHGNAASTDAGICQEGHSASCNFANQDLTRPLRLHNGIRAEAQTIQIAVLAQSVHFSHQASDACEPKTVQYRVTPARAAGTGTGINADPGWQRRHTHQGISAVVMALFFGTR